MDSVLLFPPLANLTRPRAQSLFYMMFQALSTPLAKLLSEKFSVIGRLWDMTLESRDSDLFCQSIVCIIPQLDPIANGVYPLERRL